jgi:hypothetical protein
LFRATNVPAICTVRFIQEVGMQNIEVLQQAGAMHLLRPLLLDNVPRCSAQPVVDIPLESLASFPSSCASHRNTCAMKYIKSLEVGGLILRVLRRL